MQEEIRPAEPHDRQCDSLSAPTERLGRDVQLGQALAQGVAIYTQQASRTQLIAFGPVERELEQRLLECGQRRVVDCAIGRACLRNPGFDSGFEAIPRSLGASLAYRRQDVLYRYAIDHVLACHQRKPEDRIAQFD